MSATTARDVSSAPAPYVVTAGGAIALETRVISSTDDFDALESGWSALHEQAGAGVFQSYEWQRTWWKHLGATRRNRRLHVVVLTAGDETVAIAPFFIETVPIAPLVKLRRLALIGSGVTDHLDLLVRTGLEARCCERIAAHLAEVSDSFDVLSICDVPDWSTTRLPLFESLHEHGFVGEPFVNEQCPRTLLKDTWDETLAILETRYRREAERRLRQMHKRFRVELEVCRSAEKVVPEIDEFMAMHQRRWTTAAKKGAFAEGAVTAFQREVAQLLFARGWLYLAFLRLDDRRVASICAFRHRDVLAYYLGGLAVDDWPEARKISPGIALSLLLMQDAIRQGMHVYDFLRGVESYKYECGAVDVPNWAVSMFRKRARLAKAKNVIALLEESLFRRFEQEKIAFEQQRHAHGLFSAAMARHLRNRISATLRDGMKKLRSPEKSLTAGG